VIDSYHRFADNIELLSICKMKLRVYLEAFEVVMEFIHVLESFSINLEAYGAHEVY
jgi:hypothetical protein